MELQNVASRKVAEIRMSEVSLSTFNIDGEVYSAHSVHVAVLPETIHYLGQAAI